MARIDPRALAAHYGAFLRPDRVLLTGHSHQAWPDVARHGQLEAWDAAARDVDDKWGEALAVADELRTYVAQLIGGAPDEIALGGNTHELVSRFLSALPLRERPHLLTTTGEFHSARRQLSRLAEAGLDVEWVEALPAATLSERLAARIRPTTSAVLVSSVLFETASVVPHLSELATKVRAAGAELLVDAYHAFSVVPFDTNATFPHAFVTGGGYKYAQWGEGCCFLRVPTGTALRPIYTGWFSDFAGLAHASGTAIAYGPRPADVFAGSTYDPTAHYRARSVIGFFREQGLTIERLRATSLQQTARILDALGPLDVRTPRLDADRGGFVTLAVRDASAMVEALRAKGIFVDARGELVRFGPAPYLTDEAIDGAMREVLMLARSA